MSRPDIAMIAPYPPRQQRHGGASGVASYTANLVEALTDQGASVRVIAPRDEDAPGPEPVGPLTVERPYRRGPLALPRACTAALRTGAPIVHIQHEHFLYGGPSSIPALLPSIGRLRRRRCGPVVTMHQVVDPPTVDRDYAQLHRVRAPAPIARAALAAVQRSLAAQAGACVVHEHAFAPMVPGAAVIPHGVEESSPVSRHVARRELGLDDRFVVLCFGFVAPYKGLETALAAAQLAAGDIHLVVAGGSHPRFGRDDTYGRELQRANPHATFTGYVPDEQVALWFRAADVALLNHPKPHGSSGALALAVAHGTPVLLSHGMREVTSAPAALTAPGTPEELAARLRALRAGAEERAAVRRATESLRVGRSWHEVAQDHLALYEEVRACPWP